MTARSWSSGRERAEAVLIRHRRTVVWTVPLIGALLMVLAARGPTVVADALGPLALWPPLMATANFVMALPLLIGLWPLLARRQLPGWLALALYAYVVEALAVRHGWPYGMFSYSAALDPKLAGLVPLSLPLLWLPLVVNGYLLALRGLSGRRRRFGPAILVPTAVAAVVALDLVLDPGAVALGFWGWREPGVYYGVPLVNFAGWTLTSLPAVAVVYRLLPPARVRRRLAAAPWTLDSLRAFLVFWAAVGVLTGQLAPVAVALGLAAVAGGGRADGDRAAVRSADEIGAPA